MQYDFEEVSGDVIYKLMASSIVPRPIAWITTISESGAINAAPFSFFNMMGSQPPVIAVGLQANNGNLKDTARNILATETFVVNLVPFEMASLMNASSHGYEYGINELAELGIETVPAKSLKAPLIKGAPVQMECTLLSAVPTGESQYVMIGQIKHFHIADEFVLDAAAGYIDTEKMALISRMHGRGWYSKNRDLFLLERPE
ncbi:MAG TPA: flavin reductase family protein [Candidatus Ignatzschineria merdigallinarum]|uniref:Flavin reductase family protein n=1 Tax=Candidatus Ignatzschineria merdigallinarum TaxID=2838621 RepID=A0A9D1Q3Z2_9GAMM|nr:flavin reductase family protein [Candidatus Ignatzschineria merdigallinarum]